MGDLYTHADLKRDINGNVLIDDSGNVTALDNAGDIKLGSVLPKANLAWNNSFSYKGINAGFLLTARLGGIVYSATQAYLDLYGVSETSAAARDAGGVWINGRSRVNPQSFYEVVASQSGLPTYYTLQRDECTPAGSAYRLYHSPSLAGQCVRHQRITCGEQSLDDLLQGSFRSGSSSYYQQLLSGNRLLHDAEYPEYRF